MNLNSLPDRRHTCTEGYDIALCIYGHPRYWLAGGNRNEPKPPLQVGIWRCTTCCPPLSWVIETRAVEELTGELAGQTEGEKVGEG